MAVIAAGQYECDRVSGRAIGFISLFCFHPYVPFAFLPYVTAVLVADLVSLYGCCVVDVDDMEFPYSI